MGVKQTKSQPNKRKKQPFNKPLQCRYCGSTTESADPLFVFGNYTFKCACIEQQIREHARRAFDEELQIFNNATRVIAHFQSRPKHKYDKVIFDHAVREAKRTHANLCKYAQLFGFELSQDVADWSYHA